jgi:phosphate-selective porin OprO/OprP
MLRLTEPAVTQLSAAAQPERHKRELTWIGLAGAMCWLLGTPLAPAAETAAASASTTPAQASDASPSTDDKRVEAAEADGDEPRRQLVHWNEYEGPYVTARVGGGFLYDVAGFIQDQNSNQQVNLSTADGLRDFRLLLKGRFPKLPRLSYTLGYMYDGPTKTWRFRQTGLMINVPELWGNFFIGRTKEGFSTNKIMVGYQGWTQERATANDAFLPILADGIKWSGYIPNGKFVYNVGWFFDEYSETESFNKNDQQFVARGVWLPFAGQDTRTLLHVALEVRFANSDDGALRYRSKPEAFLAQSYVIDTGSFAASHSDMIGFETYYRRGPLVIGTEYFLNQVTSHQTHDPLFHGGEIFAAYLLTGETRPYNGRGGYFERVSPGRPVFSGGPGAWELVLRYSYTDLDSGTIQGGRFWRITPMVNWHLSDNVRLEFSYGYGELDRFGVTGGTQFLQSRIQFQL